MKNTTFFILLLAFTITGDAQTNISTHGEADSVLKGLYDPAKYMPAVVIDDRATIIDGIVNQLSSDTLLEYLEILQSFHNRNSGSNTISNNYGIGAVRRWIQSKMKGYSAANDNRLISGFLDFEVNMCGVINHRNVFGILPGLDTSKKEVVLIEAHMDSRCESNCDTTCYAPGMDDNGSGTVLVMELARVMSQFAFDRTIVFTTVTGEEQGLWGGAAWAKYFKQNDINVLACLNNDVVGGIYCGNTSSPPGCSPEGSIDSTNLRVFSYSVTFDTARYSEHKQLARYVKLQQIEEINPRVAIPLNIKMEIREDREGRGGDHIPFRKEGYTSIRFTAAHEHGDGSGTAPDRQHTTTDILGVDTDMPPDGKIDSFYVNLNYLTRNAITNGVNLGLLASSPHRPDWNLLITVGETKPGGVEFNSPAYNEFRVGVRSLGSGTLYFDTVYEVKNKTVFNFPEPLDPSKTHFISVASVEKGIESLFTQEEESLPTGIEVVEGKVILTMKTFPNPSTGKVRIVVTTLKQERGNARLLFYDLAGKLVHEKSMPLNGKTHEVDADLGSLGAGQYRCIFEMKGERLISSQIMLTKP